MDLNLEIFELVNDSLGINIKLKKQVNFFMKFQTAMILDI